MSKNQSGLYIVTLNNEQPISVNAQDLRVADKSINVNKSNCKFGKAKALEGRMKSYYKTFGQKNVNFHPIVRMHDIAEAEKLILKQLDNYRIRGSSNRKNEWLKGIEPSQVYEIVISVLNEQQFDYELLLQKAP